MPCLRRLFTRTEQISSRKALESMVGYEGMELVSFLHRMEFWRETAVCVKVFNVVSSYRVCRIGTFGRCDIASFTFSAGYS
jgi:hypothetical protein